MPTFNNGSRFGMVSFFEKTVVHVKVFFYENLNFSTFSRNYFLVWCRNNDDVQYSIVYIVRYTANNKKKQYCRSRVAGEVKKFLLKIKLIIPEEAAN